MRPRKNGVRPTCTAVYCANQLVLISGGLIAINCTPITHASLALTHAMWGLKPLMIRDLVLSTLLHRADYGVSVRRLWLPWKKKRRYSLPTFVSNCPPLIQDAIFSVPRNPKLASPLHFLERLPVVRWPDDAPARGLRVRDRKMTQPTNPPEVTADPRADQTGSGARKKRGGTVAGPRARCLSPPPGDRQVLLTVPPRSLCC
ncbi:hypothetical protein B0H10DRAFT_2079170 [Mycena sp. CBHHK59/15]|nr:hypothetical protein B0H10DRAFT_2079170 [Mycena sp. CBHHK59/15]